MKHSTPPIKTLALLLGLCAALAVSVRCFQAPAFDGPYRCLEGSPEPCGGDPELVCDNGLCCRPGGEPICPSYVPAGEVCQDGRPAVSWYTDLDGDGYGDRNTRKLFCRPPITDGGLVTQGGDCNDNPAVGGALVFPSAQEQCDGLDNDCDDQIDEGFPTRQVWYLDEDLDGYGDPTTATSSCYRPDAGYITTGGDCAPSDNKIHPGASCTVPSTAGVCRASTYQCSDGSPTCPQTVFPTAETCNTLDDNCNGQVDEQPGCGGPARFNVDPNVAFGVKHLAVAYHGVPTGCVKNASSLSPPDTLNGVDGIWTGSGPESHVLWAEAITDAWDLSKPGTQLRLNFTYNINSSNSSTFWATHNQPVVLLCGPAGYVRLVHTASQLIPSSSRSGTVDNRVDVRGLSNGWQVGSGSTQPIDSVLKQVTRVEILVQPQGTCSSCSAPSFTIDFNTAAFGFQ